MPKINPEVGRNTTFDKRPENINRNGRPKKLYPQLIADAKAKGYVAPSTAEYFEYISLMFSMNENDLRDVATNAETPLWLRQLISDMNDSGIRVKLRTELYDRVFGKTLQQVDIKNTEKNTFISVIDSETEQILKNIIDSENENDTDI